MYGTFQLPPTSRVFRQRIPGWCTVTNLQWRPWRVPEGITTLDFTVIGSGAGGAAGSTAAAVSTAGGNGGGSSAVTRVRIRTSHLPKVLYLQVGAGVVGGTTSAGAGAAGILSYIAIYPDTTASNVIAVSGAAAPTGTTAGTIAAIGSMPLAGMGDFAFIAGQAGTAGVSAAAGTQQTVPVTSIITMGGAAGGGNSTNVTAFAGAGITAITNSKISQYLPVAGGAVGGGAGSGGFEIPGLMFFTPGLGGGALLTAGVAGAGGNGSFGCGGGGGGNGAGGATFGNGGMGGPGLIDIVGW